MSKIEYKPIAVQDECFGGTKEDPRIWVFVKMEGHGKKTYYRFEVKEFPDTNYLDKWLKETGLPVIPEKKIKAGIGNHIRFLAEASSRRLR